MKKLISLILCSIQNWMTDRRIAAARRRHDQKQLLLPNTSDTFFQAHLVKSSQAIDDPGVKKERYPHLYDVRSPKIV